MSEELRIMATMSALIRTAEWGVDSARDLHRVATTEHAVSKAEHESAKSAAEQAQQFTRDFLNRSTFGADQLVMAALSQALMDDEVELRQQALSAVNARVDAAHEQLMSARVTQQLYERLRERKAAIYDLDRQRRMQRDQDDAGTTLKIYEASGSTKLTGKGIVDGY